METWKKKFIEFSLEKKALKIGSFKLKSGRKSPYFFNSEVFNSGQDILKLGKFFAKEIIRLNIKFDQLFGLAYKGIPIACATAIYLTKIYKKDIPYFFNRKEKKKYGEKGILIGENPKGKVIILDDVITIGTAIQNTLKTIKNKKFVISYILVALDRKERKNKKKISSKKKIKKKYSCKIFSIITIKDLISYLYKKPHMSFYLNKLLYHYNKYKIKK